MNLFRTAATVGTCYYGYTRLHPMQPAPAVYFKAVVCDEPYMTTPSLLDPKAELTFSNQGVGPMFIVRRELYADGVRVDTWKDAVGDLKGKSFLLSGASDACLQPCVDLFPLGASAGIPLVSFRPHSRIDKDWPADVAAHLQDRKLVYKVTYKRLNEAVCGEWERRILNFFNKEITVECRI